MNENPETSECPICLTLVNYANMVELTCKHRTCKECITTWLITCIKDHKAPLKCDRCLKEVEFWEIEQIVPKDYLDKYSRILVDKSIEQSKDSIWCPKACGNVIAVMDQSATRIECVGCKALFCFKCQTPWHSDQTCESYQKWADENKQAPQLFEKYIKNSGSRRCPKCLVWIEKNHGCDHMTCQHCRYEFYWSTGKPYRIMEQSDRGDTEYPIPEEYTVVPKKKIFEEFIRDTPNNVAIGYDSMRTGTGENYLQIGWGLTGPTGITGPTGGPTTSFFSDFIKSFVGQTESNINGKTINKRPNTESNIIQSTIDKRPNDIPVGATASVRSSVPVRYGNIIMAQPAGRIYRVEESDDSDSDQDDLSFLANQQQIVERNAERKIREIETNATIRALNRRLESLPLGDRLQWLSEKSNQIVSYTPEDAARINRKVLEKQNDTLRRREESRQRIKAKRADREEEAKHQMYAGLQITSPLLETYGLDALRSICRAAKLKIGGTECELQERIREFRDSEDRMDSSRDRAWVGDSGFLAPRRITPEMAAFAGWKPTEHKSRVDITTFICSYVKSNNLQNENDRKFILPDIKLKTLLGCGNSLTYFELQKYIGQLSISNNNYNR